MINTKNVSSTIPIEMYKELKEKAEKYETNISQLIREFIQAFTDDRLMIRESKKVKVRTYRITN